MRFLTSGSSRRVPWKNGRGATLEIATDAAEPGGEWTWRLSIADVPSREPFSPFPGVDRFLACLAGPGLALEAPLVLVHAPEGSSVMNVAAEGGVFALEPGGSIITCGRVSVTGAPRSVAAACELTPSAVPDAGFWRTTA